MAYIYKVTNLVNNKVYIGQTTKTIERRWQQHIYEATHKGHGENYPLHAAMRKYGIENFIIEKLEQCQDDDRYDRETYYINLFQSLVNQYGYNIALNGAGVLLYSSEEILNLWNQGLTMKEIAKNLKCSRSTIYQRIRGCGISEEEIRKRVSDNQSARQSYGLEQYSLQGEYLGTWPSEAECARQTGFQQSALNNVAMMNQYSAYGYIWKKATDTRDISLWLERLNKKQSSGRPKKKIAQIDKQSNQILEIYESASLAAQSLGKNDKSNICKAARTGCSAYGFYWKYVEN